MTYRMPKTLALVFAAGLVFGAGTAYAFSSADECNQQADKVEADLIKANVTNEQLHQFAEDINSARQMCAGGDLAGGETKLNEVSAAIAKAGGN